jgi:hypothetical protein
MQFLTLEPIFEIHRSLLGSAGAVSPLLLQFLAICFNMCGFSNSHIMGYLGRVLRSESTNARYQFMPPGSTIWDGFDGRPCNSAFHPPRSARPFQYTSMFQDGIEPVVQISFKQYTICESDAISRENHVFQDIADNLAVCVNRRLTREGVVIQYRASIRVIDDGVPVFKDNGFPVSKKQFQMSEPTATLIELIQNIYVKYQWEWRKFAKSQFCEDVDFETSRLYASLNLKQSIDLDPSETILSEESIPNPFDFDIIAPELGANFDEWVTLNTAPVESIPSTADSSPPFSHWLGCTQIQDQATNDDDVEEEHNDNDEVARDQNQVELQVSEEPSQSVTAAGSWEEWEVDAIYD